MSSVFPAIPDPAPSIANLVAVVQALKQSMDLLTGKSADGAFVAVTADTAADTINKTTNDQTSKIANSLGDVSAQVDAFSAAIDAQIASVNADLATAVTTSNNEFATVNSLINSTRNDVTNLSTRVDNIVLVSNNSLAAAVDAEAVARISGDNALSARIDTVYASNTANAAAIQTEQAARITANSSFAGQLNTVTAVANKQRTYIQSTSPNPSSNTLIVGDVWLDSGNGLYPHYWNGSSWADATDNRLPTAIASLTSETTARTTADSALGVRIDRAFTQIDNNAAAINSESVTRSDGDSALAGRIDTVSAVASKTRTFVQGTAPNPASVTLITGDIWLNSASGLYPKYWDGSAWQDATDQRIFANAASILTESTTRATNDSTLALQINTLSSLTPAGQSTVKMQLAATSAADGAAAEFLIQVTADGTHYAYAGMRMQVFSGTPPTSRVVVDATQFLVRDATTKFIPFAIAGGQLVSNALVDHGNVDGLRAMGLIDKLTAANVATYIDTAAIGNAYIADAAINTAKIADAAITSAKIGTLQVKSANIDDLTVGNTKITGNAVSGTAGAVSSTGSASCSIIVRAGARVAYIAAYMGSNVVSIGQNSLTIYVNDGTGAVNVVSGSPGFVQIGSTTSYISTPVTVMTTTTYANTIGLFVTASSLMGGPVSLIVFELSK